MVFLDGLIGKRLQTNTAFEEFLQLFMQRFSDPFGTIDPDCLSTASCRDSGWRYMCLPRQGTARDAMLLQIAAQVDAGCNALALRPDAFFHQRFIEIIQMMWADLSISYTRYFTWYFLKKIRICKNSFSKLEYK